MIVRLVTKDGIDLLAKESPQHGDLPRQHTEPVGEG